MERTALLFTAPGHVTTCTETVEPTGLGQVLVRVTCSAISAGTELLVFRGQFPEDLTLDENIQSLHTRFEYPVHYGYAAVGKVIETGHDVDKAWLGRRIFSFQPHASHFLAKIHDLIPVPNDISDEDAVFLPNMETAVNFVMDGAPLIGERVVIFGQGIVGLLTTALLARFPLDRLVTFDRYPNRRQASLDTGAHTSMGPEASEDGEQMKALLPGGADLVYELSGSPAALNSAIRTAGFAARIVIGSWYGQKKAALDLGGRFHRSRIRLISSQVSSLSPDLSGRWNKERRFAVAWEAIRKTQPSRWITHRYSLAQAEEAYQLLDQSPEDVLQTIFRYPGEDD